jgi:hypothetical protein
MNTSKEERLHFGEYTRELIMITNNQLIFEEERLLSGSAPD